MIAFEVWPFGLAKQGCSEAELLSSIAALGYEVSRPLWQSDCADPTRRVRLAGCIADGTAVHVRAVGGGGRAVARALVDALDACPSREDLKDKPCSLLDGKLAQCAMSRVGPTPCLYRERVCRRSMEACF